MNEPVYDAVKVFVLVKLECVTCDQTTGLEMSCEFVEDLQIDDQTIMGEGA